MKKHTRTSRYIEEGLRLRLGLKATEDLPPWTGRFERFQATTTGKSEYDTEGISRELLKTWSRPIFVDTSIFDMRTPDHVWDALLAIPERIALIPPVAHELTPWVLQNPRHRAAAWLKANIGKLTLVDPASFGGEWEKAFDYYHVLLSLRKFEIQRRTVVFEQQQGRPPTAEEMQAIIAQLQQELGERGFLLANKGRNISFEAPDALSVTDESLVVLAALTAIRTGRLVMLLTMDEDLIEQVFKLFALMTAHYKSMWFARQFARDHSTFEFVEIPWDTSPWLEHIFVRQPNSYFIHTPHTTLDGALPDDWEMTGVMCIVLGDTRASALNVTMERGFSELIDIKAKTRGMNTDLLGSHNCHSSLGIGLPTPKDWDGVTAVAVDRTHDQLDEAENVVSRIAFLDLELATAARERT